MEGRGGMDAFGVERIEEHASDLAGPSGLEFLNQGVDPFTNYIPIKAALM